MKKRLLQIDSCLGIGSTGRITESIAQLAQNMNWECFIIHGARYVKRPSCMNDYQSVSIFGEYIHYVESLLFDHHGLASRRATQRVIEIIKDINPDIIQLHCVHGYYLNYKILFEFLNSTSIPVVWTFHDCWAFTGHCAHFVTAKCQKWRTECFNCPLINDYPKSLVDQSRRNYKLKKTIFTANNNLYIIPASEWLAGLVRQSFLKDKDIQVIYNGVDIKLFHPVSHRVLNRFLIIGVSSIWNKDKGLYDFYKLRDLLDKKKYDIKLIGLSKSQIENLPEGIIGIERTSSIEELASYYSSANVFVNLSYADTFPTVNLEALACGTPVVTYKTGGSPEAVDESTGVVVEQGDFHALSIAIEKLCIMDRDELSRACRKRAEKLFDKDERYKEYLSLYESLLPH